jgi:hypothetical protein
MGDLARHPWGDQRVVELPWKFLIQRLGIHLLKSLAAPPMK